LLPILDAPNPDAWTGWHAGAGRAKRPGFRPDFSFGCRENRCIFPLKVLRFALRARPISAPGKAGVQERDSGKRLGPRFRHLGV
jgi:hypothetical protein